MCLVCAKPGRRLAWDSYGAALDDQGQFCSFECKEAWERNAYVHPTWCQCVTCIARKDRERAAGALRKAG